MSDPKTPPNPHGRKGGAKHRAKISEVADNIEQKGFRARFEYMIKMFSGKKRFVDVVAIDMQTNQVTEMHQIGKTNKDGTPVKRERLVMDEIEKQTGERPYFHSYNVVKTILITAIVAGLSVCIKHWLV